MYTFAVISFKGRAVGHDAQADQNGEEKGVHSLRRQKVSVRPARALATETQQRLDHFVEPAQSSPRQTMVRRVGAFLLVTEVYDALGQ